MAKKTNKKAVPNGRGNGNFQHIVVIGASAGGNQAILDLVSQLEPSANAAYFIVIHITNVEANRLFADRMRQITTLACHIAANGKSIEMGCIYLAPADSHLMIKKDRISPGSRAS